MDSRRTGDMLSTLPDYPLVLIISGLPFKEALSTSVLSSRWKNLCYETKNISFKELEFFKCFDVANDEESKRVARASFVRYVVDWVSRFSGQVIESFELCLSKTVGFEKEIELLIEFAVHKQVRNLVIDFSDPCWINYSQPSVFQLPKCVYNVVKLESLKLSGCMFDPSRFSKPGFIKRLSIGWTHLGKILSLLSKTPLLESLTISNCWNVGMDVITKDNNRLGELVFENCDFEVEYTTVDLTNIHRFKYIGKFHYFQFMEVNKKMKEAYLDFKAETEYDENTTGELLCGLLNDLSSAETLTICPFVSQVIQDSEYLVHLQGPLETKHLVINTNLQPGEFVGIRCMINSCPLLETITFVMVPHRPVLSTDVDFDPDKYWSNKITHKCLKKTLKVVEVRTFTGGMREMQVLRYLIRHGELLERVDLYLSRGWGEDAKTKARDFLERRCVRASKGLMISLHEGCRISL